jgi:hypothetical protein
MMISSNFYWAILVTGLLSVVVMLVSRQSKWWCVMEHMAAARFNIALWWQSGLIFWREEVSSREGCQMQITVGAAALVISLSLGYGYSYSPAVNGWLLWTWLVGVVMTVSMLVSLPSWPGVHLADWHWLLAIGLLALLLRVTLLETVPGGLHVDEMGVADFAARHVMPPEGHTINPFYTGAASQPALYHYLVRLAFAVFGYSIFGLRISSVVAGTLAVIATYMVVAIFQDRRTALLAAGIMMAYHYHIH